MLFSYYENGVSLQVESIGVSYFCYAFLSNKLLLVHYQSTHAIVINMGKNIN